MTEPATPERGMEAVTGQRPERQLNDVVIEFYGRVLEIMHAVDDEHRDQRSCCPDHPARRHKDQREGDDDDGLR